MAGDHNKSGPQDGGLVTSLRVQHLQSPYRPKLPVSIVTALILLFGVQFIVFPRYLYGQSESERQFSQFNLDRLEARLRQCNEYNTLPVRYSATTAGSRANPRWNPITGQNETIILRNATLFDGESFRKGPVDVVLKKGIIDFVTPTREISTYRNAVVVEMEGRYATPGLVDMHSHHMAMSWPLLRSTDDTNEINDATGPLTPQMRIIDSLKAYDIATGIIASGGVTTSLILPGSANVMGGEAVLVKNAIQTGENSEVVVEDMLLEHGIPISKRRRFMKMACGENPRRVYKHTRMGNAWVFRKHMERAKELKTKQDAICLAAVMQKEHGDDSSIAKFLQVSEKEVSATELLEYDSTIAMLQGKIGINVHCYEPEDFEDMIKHSKEFGFRIQAFHHALSAYEVPEMIKASGENITIATFSEFGFYKKEAYEANLWAGKILSDHDVPVAYKSITDVQAETNAKYLMFQAATAHSFHLPEDLALASVTSVPAKSMEIDHRVGYVRPGYDADVVVWDSHPLSLGATPLQVYVDGRTTLDPKIVENSLKHSGLTNQRVSAKPAMRETKPATIREAMCSAVEKPGSKITVTGIAESFLQGPPTLEAPGNMTMVVDNGRVVCFDSYSTCSGLVENSIIINLKNGYVLPGLSAVTVSLGLYEITTDDTTGDGRITGKVGPNPDEVVYAKYGIHLNGKSFGRARIGGVTKAITAPVSQGFVDGVSVAIKTSGNQTVLNGGILQDDVALHFAIGQESKASDSVSTVSAGISTLRHLLKENMVKDNVYGRAANGSIPLVVHAHNEYDIMQLIKIKQDQPQVKLVVLGGAGAPLVAQELAAAKIPVILTANRGAPDSFETLNSLPGPPLSRSAASVLAEAGVLFALSIPGESDSHIHNIPLEAAWAAKYAGLSSRQAVDLVSRNLEQILDLHVVEAERDFVVWEGNPLEFGAQVVLGVDEMGVSMCWPEAQ